MDTEIFEYVLFFLAFWIIIVYAGIIGIWLGWIKVKNLCKEFVKR